MISPADRPPQPAYVDLVMRAFYVVEEMDAQTFARMGERAKTIPIEHGFAETATISSPCRDALVFRARQRVLTCPNENVIVSYPEDWWQAFKARWFPRWCLRRWPAKWHTVSIDKYAVYPEIPMRGGGYYHRISMLDVDHHEWSQTGDEK